MVYRDNTVREWAWGAENRYKEVIKSYDNKDYFIIFLYPIYMYIGQIPRIPFNIIYSLSPSDEGFER